MRASTKITNSFDLFPIGNPEAHPELYLEVKHMFLYRDPIKNIVSLLSMASGMTKSSVRKFQRRMVDKVIRSLCPDITTYNKTIEDERYIIKH